MKKLLIKARNISKHNTTLHKITKTKNSKIKANSNTLTVYKLY